MRTRLSRLRGVAGTLARTAAVLAVGLGCLQAQAALVSLMPAASPLANVGDVISLDLSVSGVADLYGYNFSLKFDPSVVNVTGLAEGPALSTAGAAFFAPGAFDNVNGLLELTGETLLAAIPGYTGSGVLATITFTAMGGGSTAIALNDLFLINSSLFEIASTGTSATIQVAGANTVPEPATLALVLASLALMSRRWRPTAAKSATPT